MEALIIYIAKASGLLVLFLTAYYFLLRKETFFSSNRGFLLAGLITSALLPLAQYTKVIFIDPAPQETATQMQPVDIQQYMQMQQMMAEKPETFTINWFYVAFAFYGIGVLFFAARFILDIIAIRRILKGHSIVKEGSFRLIDSDKVQSPFSFFNYIVYNSSVLQPEELRNIISHEKVHSSQKHSLDMIISQLFCIVFWFNPFVWLYKKTISQNLEFIADSVAIQQLADKVAYQKTLLKITLQPECITITNHFYQSLIKKRIVMLNKKQSKKSNSWKYTMILPALAAFVLVFQVKVVAQEKAPEISSTSQEKIKMSISIDKDASDKELTEGATIFKDEFDADVTFSEIKRNASGEITAIKVTVKDRTQSQDHYVSGSNPIKPFTVELEKSNTSNENTIAFGNPNPTHITAGSVSVASTAAVPPLKAKAQVITSANTNNSTNETNGLKVTNFTKGSLFVVNGVQQKDMTGDFSQLQLPKGQQVANMTILSPKDAKKKYGKAGKKGVIEIETKAAPANRSKFNYSFDDGELESTINMDMPDIDQIMAMARDSVTIGMNVLTNIDWQEVMAAAGLSEEERKEIRKEIGIASIEAKKAMEEMKIDREEFMKSHKEAFEGKEFRKEEMKQAMKEMEKARADIKKAQKELERAKKDFEKNKALNKKS